EVYRAHDPRLQRDVALKVLPSARSNDPEAVARLVREARLASRLNHPHICTIHEVGESDGLPYIAMELVEGEPLTARVRRGPLPKDEAVAYAFQIADALEEPRFRALLRRMNYPM